MDSHMNDNKITESLEQLIEQARAWLGESAPALVDGFKIRKFPCIAVPLEFLDDAARKERCGILFRLEWEDSSGQVFVDVEMRVHTVGNLPETGPYVIFRLIQPDGKPKELNWFQLTAASTQACQDVLGFCREYLKMLLRESMTDRENACAVIFRYKRVQEEQG